jgi:YegS/Rv2252/BmrU family lipid kinase
VIKDILVIVNPASQGGRTAKRWLQVQERLRDAGLDFEAALTTRPHEAIEIARRAVRASVPVVVAAGGDGTVNEVANGFFDTGKVLATKSVLGVLPLGTGGDFRRTFDIPEDPTGAVEVLRQGKPCRIDVGRATFTTAGGHMGERYFVNVADAGIGGEVVDRVNRSSKRLGGTATFLLASMNALARYRNKWMRVMVDGNQHELVAQQVVIANGTCYGAGMKIAPHARADDGLFDVLLIGDLGVVDNLRGLAKIRQGRHLEDPVDKYTYLRARRVEVQSPERVLIDLDGEQPGMLPASFEIIPAALTLLTPAA